MSPKQDPTEHGGAPAPSEALTATGTDGAAAAPRSRPPTWLWRAFGMAALTGMVAVFLWHAISALSSLLLMLLCSLFVALAIEPPVTWLVQRKWK
ncbi:MAG: hypothetical protein LBJ08_03805, partial [Bifidobacteriaceae bacterium]|nr:hypothetical protein [Bifidobacteriaceae bacterium]